MLRLISILTIGLISLNHAGDKYPKIKSKDIEKLRIDLREAIYDSTFIPENPDLESGKQPLIGSIVRLIFHDCAGKIVKQNPKTGKDLKSGKLTDNICNGCFDFDEFDNAGLEENAFNPLEDIYQLSDNEWYKKMSRADFWAASATIALEIAGENSYIDTIFPIVTPAPLPDIPYYFGREDCPRSPFATQEGVFEFPQSNAGWDEISSWMAENLGFSARETVVSSGGHTLGAAHGDAIGFIGNWVARGHVLDHSYFQNFQTEPVSFMGGVDFRQRRVGDLEFCTEYFSDVCDETNDNFQWVIGPDAIFGANAIGAFVQLNSDISMILRIVDYLDRETGIVNCTAPGIGEFFGGPPSPNRCPLQDGVYQIVNEFSADNQLFLNEFAAVMEKMMLNGLKAKKLQKLIVPYDRSFENVTFTTTTSAASQQIVGQLQQNGIDTGDDNDDVDDVDDGVNVSSYYIGLSLGLVVLCMVIMVYIIYRYYKRKSSMLLKEIKQCNNYGINEKMITANE